jgi:hypothetical protein
MNCISSSRVFSATLATLIAAIFATDLHAGASNKNGNPFGNGSFFSNTGTFSAVVRGSNLSGTLYFSTGTDSNSASTNSSPGSSDIVYEGYTYTGNSQASWNPSSSAISGQLNGGQLLSGTNSSTVISPIPPTIVEKVTNTIVTNTTVDPFTGATNSTASNITTTNMIVIGSVGKNSFNSSLYMSGSFLGNVNNSYPNQTFSAYGNVIQEQLASQTAGEPATVASVTIPISVSGIRISDTITSFATISNSVPYSTTTYQPTNY